MTENLAGRGLAGLVEKWRQSCSVGSLYKEGTVKPVDVREGVLRCADALEAEIAALEAAAPPSTAPPRQVTSDCMDQLREMLDRKDLSGADLYALNEAITALATPSPQATPEQGNAFSTTSAREQSSATASDSLGAAIWNQALEEASEEGSLAAEAYIENLDDGQVIRADSLAVRVEASILALKKPSATQPAGSGADSLNEAAQEILKPHWPSVRNMEENEARQKEVERIVRILRGSPRKVGEDGAKVGDEVTWTGQEGKQCRERIRRITEPQPGNYVFWVGEDEFPVNHQQVELVARPSSAPVGEPRK